jgi:WD40 repeat protein/tetratricopeptide (TPR) repeat protein
VTVSEPFPPPLLDEVRDRFALAWRAGQTPRIEDFLAGADPEKRLPLARALLALEAHLRRQAGETPRPEDYRDRLAGLDLEAISEALQAPSETEAPSPLRPAEAIPAECPTSNRSADSGAHIPGGRASGATARAEFPGYEILGELGRGGMGVVYKAVQLKLKRTVALKVIRGAGAGPQELARFRAEAEAAARLQHPNIVQVFEVGESVGDGGPGVPYLALEYVEGTNLARRLAGTPLADRHAAVLVEQLARAMQYAHERGVVHRDLKPGNILLPAGTFVPRIADFGLAKQLDDDSGQTQTGQVLGTPSYMAPEQAQGKRDVGPPADVYALGAILYECLTGRPPFKAASVLETLEQVRSQEPAPVRQLQPKVPRDLETVCLKCLHKEPAKRYHSSADLADELRRFLDGRPILARPVGAVGRAWRWRRRNPAVAGLLAAVVALLVSGTAISSYLAVRMFGYAGDAETKADRAEKEAERANINFEDANASRKIAEERLAEVMRLLYTARMREAVDFQQRGDVVAVQEFLKGLVPRPGEKDLRGLDWHYLWQWAHGYRLSLGGKETPCTSSAFQDGGRTLVAAGRGNVTRYAARTGQKMETLAAESGLDYEVQLAGNRVVVCGRTNRKQTWWVVEGGRLRQLLELDKKLIDQGADKDSFRWVATPGLDSVAVVWGNQWYEQTLEIFDVRSGKPRFSGRKLYRRAAAFSPDGKTLAIGRAGGDKDDRVDLLDAITGAEVGFLTLNKGQPKGNGGARGQVLGLAYLGPARLAVLEAAGTVVVWNTASRTVLRRVKTPGASAFAISPDEKWLATDKKSEAGPILLYELRTGKIDGEWWGHTDSIRGLTFSPDGLTVASGCDGDGTVKLWNVVRSPAGARADDPPSQRVNAVVFSADGGTLFSSGNDHTVRIHDVKARVERACLRGHSAVVGGLALSGDGQTLASAARDGTVRLWDAATGRPRAVLQAGADAYCVAWGPGGRLAAGTAGGVKLWAAPGGKAETLPESTRPALGLAFSPDGGVLAVGEKNVIRLYDVAQRRQRAVLTAHDDWIAALVFTIDGKRLFSAGWDQRLRIWDVGKAREAVVDEKTREGLKVNIANAYYGAYRALSLSRDGRRLAAVRSRGPHVGEVVLWEVTETGLRQRGIQALAETGTAAALSRDGRRLAAGNYNGSLPLWDLPEKLAQERILHVPTRYLPGHSNRGTALALAPDGRTAAEAEADFTVRLVDVVTGKERAKLLGHTGPVTAVAFSADGRRVITGSLDLTVKVHDASTGREISTGLGAREGVRCVALSPDGSLAAAGDGDTVDCNGLIRLYEADTGTPRRVIEPKRLTVWTVAFCPDGRTLAASTWSTWSNVNGKLSLWNVSTGKEVGSLGGLSRIGTLAFSHDGLLLASSDQGDGAVRLWDVARRTQLALFPGHPAESQSVAFLPDSNELASRVGGRLRFQDVGRLAQRSTMILPPGCTFGPFFPRDGRGLVLGDAFGRATLWRVPSEKERRAYEESVRAAGAGGASDGPDYQRAHYLLELAAAQSKAGHKATARRTFSEAEAILKRLAVGRGPLAGRASEELDSFRKGDSDPFASAVALVGRDPDLLLARARRLRRYRNYESAVAACRAAIALRPSADAYVELAANLLNLDRNAETVEAAQAALRLDANNARALLNLGVGLEHLGQLDEAESAYRRAAELDSAWVRPHYNLANLELHRGRPDQAVIAARRAVQLDPKDSWNHIILTASLLRDRPSPKKNDEALAAAREAVRLDPKGSKAHNNLGVCLERKGLDDEAVAAYQHAARLDRDYVLARRNLGSLLHKKGRTAEAVKTYQEVVRLAPENAPDRVFLGRCLGELKRADEALELYREAVTLDPNLVEGHEYLGLALQRKGQLADAAKAFRAALAVDAKSSLALDGLADVLERQGRRAEAVAFLEGLLRRDAKNHTARRCLGLMLLKEERWSEGAGHLVEARRHEFVGIDAIREMALLYAHCPDPAQRKPTEAVAMARKLVEKYPELDFGPVLLGGALYRIGDFPAAREALTKSLSLYVQGNAEAEFFLAMTQYRQGEKEGARLHFARGVWCLKKMKAAEKRLLRYRDEAAEVLGLKK